MNRVTISTKTLFSICGGVLLFLLLPMTSLADGVQYIYDHLGRLARVVNDQGEVATYTYDGVGNLLSITRATTGELAPQIDSIDPSQFITGIDQTAAISGQNFLGGTVSTDNPGIVVTGVQLTDDHISAVFSTAVAAPNGTYHVTVTTPLGASSVEIQVSGASVTPTQLTANPGNNLVILDWDDNAEPELLGYSVYRGSTAGGPYTKLTPSLIGTSYYHDTTAVNGNAYYYVVTATDTGLPESVYSNEASANVAGTGPTPVCGTIGGQTWTLVGSPYQVTCDSTVRNSGLLTIEPGVRVEFSTGSGLTIGLVGGTTSVAPGAIHAVGTEAAPITFTSASASPAPGDWKGINFTDPTVDVDTVLDHVIVEYGGSGTGGANITLSAVSFPIGNSLVRDSAGDGIRSVSGSIADISGSTVSNNAGYGFYMNKTGSATVAGTRFENNGSYAVRVRVTSVGNLSGNTYSGNSPNAIEVMDQYVESTQTWRNEGVPLIISEDFFVRKQSILTLEAGLQLEFADGVGLQVGIPGSVSGVGPGAINAAGTGTNPVVFTSASASPTPGIWKGIFFSTETTGADTLLDHVIVEYGGGDTNNADITIDGVAFSIANSTVRLSDGDGIKLIGSANLALDTVTVSGNAAYGVRGNNSASLASSNGSFQGNGSYAVRIKANGVGGLTGNTFSGNNPDAIEVVNTGITTTQDWTETGAPLVVTQDLLVNNNAVLTVHAGVQVRFMSGIGMTIGCTACATSTRPGALAVMGSVSDPVIFTSNNATPSPGDWNGILFVDYAVDASSLVDYALVEYGTTNIRANSATFPITNSTIRYASGSGIRLQGSSSVVHDNSITNNVTNGLLNASASTIDAENNWWGDPSGPTHASNPGGTGDTVSDGVDFDPWLTTPP